MYKLSSVRARAGTCGKRPTLKKSRKKTPVFSIFVFSFLIRSKENKDYMLQMDSGKIPVYCHMTSHGIGACGGGGWTLVLKIDGEKVHMTLNDDET